VKKHVNFKDFRFLIKIDSFLRVLFMLNLFMDMSSTEPVTQPAPNAPKGPKEHKPRPPKAPKDPNAPQPEPKARKPRPPKAPKDPNAPPPEPKARKPRPPKAPKDPNAPPPEPKARKPRPPKAPKDPNAPTPEPKARKPRKPRPPKPDITHSGPIHYHETDEPTKPPFVAVYSETLEEDVPPKQRKTRSSGLDLSMANLRI
jgi:hypothetical protein